MGKFVNPGNEGFCTALRGRYVDKTGLIRLFDFTLDSSDKLVMVSRPRRFGKSYAAASLVAFYSRGCDSRQIFAGLDVARKPGWDAHLNGYNVVYLDMTEVIQYVGPQEISRGASNLILDELDELVPDSARTSRGSGAELFAALEGVVEATGNKFVFVIDEWDAPYRLSSVGRVAQDGYAEWLRALFKGATFTPRVVAGAYLTGILPIKKYAHQSAVSDFAEYTMVEPGPYAPYVGFTDGEVAKLCQEFALDEAEVRHWYDGYALRYRDELYDVYAPYSMMRACRAGKTGSYWPSTEAFESLRPYIDMDFDGLQTDLVKAIGGARVPVDPDGFQNDMKTILSRDDVLTLLVHLGYLSYDSALGVVRVPNDEVRRELARAVRRSHHPKLMELMAESIRLLQDVIDLNADAVAEGFQRVHDRDCGPLFYNNEQALRAVVRSALVAAVDDYARIEELPSGKGYADVAYIPSRGSMLPALLVELKWNLPADAAIDQISERGYPEVLRGLDVPIILVGVTYDAKTKKHDCRMELLED